MTRNALNTNKPIEIARGGTSTTTYTTDGVVYYDGAKLNSTDVGTSGQVLTSNGTSAPTFQGLSLSGAVGNWILLQTQNLTGTSATFTSLGGYVNLAMIYSQVYLASGTGSDLNINLSSDGGSTWVATGYLSGLWYLQSLTGTAWSNVNSTIYIRSFTGMGNIASYGLSGTTYIYGMNTAASLPSVIGETNHPTFFEKSAGYLSTAGNYNAIQVSLGGAAGTLAGTISLYGIAT